MATIKGIKLASDIYDLEDTQGRTATQTAQNTADNASSKADSNETAIKAIQNIIPSTASSSNKLATQSDIPDVSQLETNIENIQAVVPSSATAQNKLATLNDLTKAKLFMGEPYKGKCKVDESGLYLLFIDRHGSEKDIAVKLVACYSNNQIASVDIASNTQITFTVTYNTETNTISVSGATGITVNALYVGLYF